MKIIINYLIYIPIVLFLVVLSSCEDSQICIRGRGKMSTEVRECASFTKVHINDINAKVLITIADSTSFTLKGQYNVLQNIDSYIVDDILNIEFDRCVRATDSIFIILTTTELNGIKLSADGEITVAGSVLSEMMDVKLHSAGTIIFDSLLIENEIDIDITGSGSIVFNGLTRANEMYIMHNGSGNIFFDDLTCNELFVEHKGSGEIKLKNNVADCSEHFAANSLNIQLENSGKFDSYNFCANNVFVESRGSGNCFVNAHSILDVKIFSSGNVYFNSMPVSIRKEITGSGKLIKE